MIIPIGHTDLSVRRLPWATFAIILICLGVYLLSLQTESRAQAEFEVKLQDVMTHYTARPFLKLDPRLPQAFGQSQLPSLAMRQDLLENFKGIIPEPGEQSLMQAELDRRTALALEVLDRLPQQRFGFRPAHPHWWTLLAYMFLHAGFFHLLTNMFLLYLSGPFLEDVWGKGFFLLLYLLGGVAAALLFSLHYPAQHAPLVGASGAVSALLGAFLVRHWHARIRFFYWFFITVRGTFEARAIFMLPLWFAGELLNAWLSDSMNAGQSGGVAYWAHIWGFAFGVVAALAVRFARLEERFLSPELDSGELLRPNLTVEKARRLLAAGKAQDAFLLMRKEFQRQPTDPRVPSMYWETALAANRAAEASPAVLRLLRGFLQTEEPLEAWNCLLALRQHAPDAAVEPALCIRLAEGLSRVQRQLEAASLLRDTLPQLPKPVPIAMLLLALKAARAADPRLALELARQARVHPELPPQKRAEVEDALEKLTRGPLLPTQFPQEFHWEDHARHPDGERQAPAQETRPMLAVPPPKVLHRTTDEEGQAPATRTDRGPRLRRKLVPADQPAQQSLERPAPLTMPLELRPTGVEDDPQQSRPLFTLEVPAPPPLSATLETSQGPSQSAGTETDPSAADAYKPPISLKKKRDQENPPGVDPWSLPALPQLPGDGTPLEVPYAPADLWDALPLPAPPPSAASPLRAPTLQRPAGQDLPSQTMPSRATNDPAALPAGAGTLHVPLELPGVGQSPGFMPAVPPQEPGTLEATQADSAPSSPSLDALLADLPWRTVLDSPASTSASDSPPLEPAPPRRPTR